LLELFHQCSHIVVNIDDHAEESGMLFAIHMFSDPGLVFLGGDEGAMGCIGRNVSKEWLAGVMTVFDPTQGLLKKDIGAES
jgi:hypothetical protein